MKRLTLSIKKYNSIILIPLGIVFLILYALALTLEPIDGDLTRTGPYLESEFGWNAPQEQFEKDLYVLEKNEKYDKYYDVVIVGDSYSTMEFTYQWQNYLKLMTGLSSITFNIHSTDIDKLLTSENFKKHPPKILIWQFVERSISLGPRYTSTDCTPEANPSLTPVSISPSGDTAIPYERDRTVSFFSPNFNESSHYLKYFSRGFFVSKMGKHSRTIRLPLNTGGLFSSKNDREILLFNRDFWKVQRFKEEFLESRRCYITHIQNLSQKNGKTFFVALPAPDKTTVYEDFVEFREIKNINLLELLDTDPRLHFVRLDRTFKKKIKEGVVDIYPPNETHWGSRGHRIVVETLIQYLKDLQVIRR